MPQDKDTFPSLPELIDLGCKYVREELQRMIELSQEQVLWQRTSSFPIAKGKLRMVKDMCI